MSPLTPHRLFALESLLQSVVSFLTVAAIAAVCPSGVFAQFCFVQSLVLLFHSLSLAIIIEPRLSGRYDAPTLHPYERWSTRLLVAVAAAIAVFLLSPTLPSALWKPEHCFIFFLWLYFLNDNVSKKKRTYVESDPSYCMHRIWISVAAPALCSFAVLSHQPHSLIAIATIPILSLVLQSPLFAAAQRQSPSGSSEAFSFRTTIPFLAAAACSQMIYTAPLLVAGFIAPVPEFADLRMLLIFSQPAITLQMAHAQGAQARIYRVHTTDYTVFLRTLMGRSLLISIGYCTLVAALLLFVDSGNGLSETVLIPIRTADDHLPFTLTIAFLPFLIVPACIALRIDRDPMMLTKCYALAGTLFLIALTIGYRFFTLIEAYTVAAAIAHIAFYIVFSKMHNRNHKPRPAPDPEVQ